MGRTRKPINLPYPPGADWKKPDWYATAEKKSYLWLAWQFFRRNIDYQNRFAAISARRRISADGLRKIALEFGLATDSEIDSVFRFYRIAAMSPPIEDILPHPARGAVPATFARGPRVELATDDARIDLGKGTWGIVVVDLAGDVAAQLKAVRPKVEGLQRLAAARIGKKIEPFRPERQTLAAQLRIFDAQIAGATNDDIRRTIYPDSREGVPDNSQIGQQLLAARNYATRGYLKLRMKADSRDAVARSLVLKK